MKRKNVTLPVYTFDQWRPESKLALRYRFCGVRAVVSIVPSLGEASSGPKKSESGPNSDPAVNVRPASLDTYSQVEPTVAPGGAVLERGDAYPPIWHCASKVVALETAGTVKVLPTE